MLTKPKPMAVKALYSFSNHTGWDDVSKFFDDELAKVHEVLVSSPDEVTLRQMQGRAQFIREFLDLVANAPKVLEKLRESSL
jgi:predicted ester cyclase